MQESRGHADADLAVGRLRLARQADQAGGGEAPAVYQPAASVTVR
jgi:hypothetical protein